MGSRRSESDGRRSCSLYIFGFIVSLALLIACGSTALASYTVFFQPHDDKITDLQTQLSIENLMSVIRQNISASVMELSKNTTEEQLTSVLQDPSESVKDQIDPLLL